MWWRQRQLSNSSTFEFQHIWSRDDVFLTLPLCRMLILQTWKKFINVLQMCLRCFSLRHIHATGNSSFWPLVRVSGPCPLGVATLLIIENQLPSMVGNDIQLCRLAAVFQGRLMSAIAGGYTFALKNLWTRALAQVQNFCGIWLRGQVATRCSRKISIFNAKLQNVAALNGNNHSQMRRCFFTFGATRD